ncbi:hypothetical protein OHA21_26175 [Actinoplanes sp. NBC_00393]|uniref:hypothetical protein n=1 Tax=Actinoplanes sp. NBC_00393 TaxID=2975953 RepID=UPI002E24C0A6
MLLVKSLVVGAAIAVVLAVIGVTAMMAALNPSAAEVASTSNEDPAVPPDFYGTR